MRDRCRGRNRLVRLIFLLFLAGTAACGTANLHLLSPPQAVEGVLDLRQWDFARDGLVRLNGDWEFYWEQLLTNDDFGGASRPPLTEFIMTPGAWNGLQLNGQPIRSKGYATYRLTILLPPSTLPDELLALKTPVPITTAHRLFIDEKLLGRAGLVATTADEMIPQIADYIAYFVPSGDQIEISLQVSNFYHPQGGVILSPLVLGTPTDVQRLNNQLLGIDLFLAGSIFIMGLYHLGLFSLRRRDRSSLYFGLFCIAVVGITLLSRQPTIFAHHLSTDWTIFARTLLLMSTLSILALAHFVHALFPQEGSVWAARLFSSLAMILSGLVILLPTRSVTFLMFPMVLYLGLVILYSFWLALRAVAHRQTGATIFLAGFLPLLLASLNDVLFFTATISTQQLVSVGLFLFIFVQAYQLSVRFSSAFVRSESLSAALLSKNETLERAHADLRRSEEKYRTLFDDSRDLVFISTVEGRIESVNSACMDLLGYTREEAMAMHAGEFYADPEDLERFQAAMYETGSTSNYALRMLHKEGREVECQVTATVRRDEAGRIIGYQGIVHDITALKEAERESQRALALRDLNRALERRLEERTTALTEVNATLQAEIARRRSHQSEKDRLLQLAQQQSEHLRAMNNWLVDVRLNTDNEPTDGQDAEMRHRISLTRQNLASIQTVVAFERDPGLTSYLADAIRLLAEMELFLEQISRTEPRNETTEDQLSEDLLLKLSARERQVLKFVGRGMSNPEIADAMTIRLNTVHTYLKRIRGKFGMHKITDLADFARRHRFLD